MYQWIKVSALAFKMNVHGATVWMVAYGINEELARARVKLAESRDPNAALDGLLQRESSISETAALNDRTRKVHSIPEQGVYYWNTFTVRDVAPVDLSAINKMQAELTDGINSIETGARAAVRDMMSAIVSQGDRLAAIENAQEEPEWMRRLRGVIAVLRGER